VIAQARDRQAQYDAAFRAATGLSWRDADKAWREWFATR
jgi:LPS sulfotransferase NodH